MWFNWFGISKKKILLMSGKSGVHAVSTSFSFLVYRWMNAAGRWADSIPLPTFDSATTSVWYANDVIGDTWNCLCFSIKKLMNSIWNDLRNQMKCFNLVPSRLVLNPKKKTERISLPHWLAATCAHCSVSNNGRTGWNVDQTHTFVRIVIINEPLNLRKTKMEF